VKFQYFNPDRLVSAEAELAAYQKTSTDHTSLRDLLRPLALDLAELGRLRERARERGLAFLVTPFSVDDCAELKALKIDAVKIASPDAVNTPLLEAAAGLRLPMLISTGACEVDELHPALDAVLRSRGALLQCVSAYPTPIANAALGGIAHLAEWAEADVGESITVGYSDHTAAVETGAMAVAAGARILEKHLTADRSAAGPDHAASLEPEAFAEYVTQARDAATRRLDASVNLNPDDRKTFQAIEWDVRRVSRQSVAARSFLATGHRLRAEDLTTMRPGTGIPARRLGSIIGKTLTTEVHAGHLIPESALI
jgi:sialic acid synthase SpsE